MKHHQTTNRNDDPFLVFNSRWMILFGPPTAIALNHLYAWRHLRGRVLGRYLIELFGLFVLVAFILALPRPLHKWSLTGPLIVVAVLQTFTSSPGTWICWRASITIPGNWCFPGGLACG